MTTPAGPPGEGVGRLTAEQALAWFGEPRYSVTDLQRAWAEGAAAALSSPETTPAPEAGLRAALTEIVAAVDTAPAGVPIEYWVRFQSAVLGARAALAATPPAAVPHEQGEALRIVARRYRAAEWAARIHADEPVMTPEHNAHVDEWRAADAALAALLGESSPYAAALSSPETTPAAAHYWVGDHGVADGGNVSAPETTPAGVLDEAALAAALYDLAMPEFEDSKRWIWPEDEHETARMISRAYSVALAAALGRSGSGGGRG